MDFLGLPAEKCSLFADVNWSFRICNLLIISDYSWKLSAGANRTKGLNLLLIVI